MKVNRIVANISTPNPGAAKDFYQDVLGLDLLMDHGWIANYGRSKSVQVSFAAEGGSGAPVPDLSIEVP